MNQTGTTQLSRKLLFEQGLYLQQMTPPARLTELIRSLCPQRTFFDLVRVGGSADGGYLLPNDLNGITACFSPGVDINASFETDLLNRFGIGSHLADYSVPGPPSGFEPRSFTKKFLGTVDTEQYITLDSWMAQQPEYLAPGDFLLQMDIEGAEYATLLSARPEHLARYRIMIIEFHHVEHWSDAAFFEIVSSTFSKLMRDFIIVHNHPNNCCGIVNMGGVHAPRVFELTFLR